MTNSDNSIGARVSIWQSGLAFFRESLRDNDTDYTTGRIGAGKRDAAANVTGQAIWIGAALSLLSVIVFRRGNWKHKLA